MLVLQALHAIGITKGVELLQIHVIQSREFPQNTACRCVQRFIGMHKVAGQGHLEFCL